MNAFTPTLHVHSTKADCCDPYSVSHLSHLLTVPATRYVCYVLHLFLSVPPHSFTHTLTCTGLCTCTRSLSLFKVKEYGVFIISTPPPKRAWWNEVVQNWSLFIWMVCIEDLHTTDRLGSATDDSIWLQKAN